MKWLAIAAVFCVLITDNSDRWPYTFKLETCLLRGMCHAACHVNGLWGAGLLYKHLRSQNYLRQKTL